VTITNAFLFIFQKKTAKNLEFVLKTALKSKSSPILRKILNLFRKGYKCKCEELNATNHLSFDDCYIFDGDGDSIVLDTEPTTTTLTAEPSTTFLDTMVRPSLLPPEEITDEETSTTTSRKD
jgi:hypothetical protein